MVDDAQLPLTPGGHNSYKAHNTFYPTHPPTNEPMDF